MRIAPYALVAAAIATPALAAPPGWLGRYVYEQSLGRGPGGDAPFITHTLTLGPKTCTLRTEGFQVFEVIRCDVVWRGDAVNILFLGYDDEARDANLRPIKHYRPGEPLLTLTRTARGLQTRWQGYARKPAKAALVGRYFR
jgi:hypothetical protein